MGQYTAYTLKGWDANGDPLDRIEKGELADLMYEAGADNCSEPDDDARIIMMFDSESYLCGPKVTEALADYAMENPEIMLELETSCTYFDEHTLTRSKGEESEEVEKQAVYPPFTRLVMPCVSEN